MGCLLFQYVSYLMCSFLKCISIESIFNSTYITTQSREISIKLARFTNNKVFFYFSTYWLREKLLDPIWELGKFLNKLVHRCGSAPLQLLGPEYTLPCSFSVNNKNIGKWASFYNIHTSEPLKMTTFAFPPAWLSYSMAVCLNPATHKMNLLGPHCGLLWI